MGLIKALFTAGGTTLGDQWKEFFYCDAIASDVLVVKGKKRVSKRSSNTKGSDNIISNGSGIAVADGQCMIIVEQGKVVEICAEPGEFTYDSSTEPSIFFGNLGQGIFDIFSTVGKRITYGGDTGKDQRVYYFNLKEIMDNKYGTANPVPFRVVDTNIGLDIDITIRCHGTYAYKIVNPILFYSNVCGNIQNEFRREEIDGMLKGELLTALQPAFAKISEMGIRYSAVPAHTSEIVQILDEELDEKWHQLRGLKIVSMTVNSITANKEDEDLIKSAQKTAILRNPTMAAATLVEAQSEALKKAAGNEGGAMVGFMGMNMVQQAGKVNIQDLYTMEGTEESFQENQTIKEDINQWVCPCGAKNTGKYCIECGQARPNGWMCSCGTLNQSKFCMECGQPKPVDAPLYRCDKCGWKPEDPMNPPKFCPECGDPFDENDKR